MPEQNPTETDLDIVFSLYAPTPEERDIWHERMMKTIGDDSAVLAFMQDSDPLDPVGQKIHFGYRDGISQPRINGFSETNPELDDRPEVDSWRFIINLIVGNSSSPPTYHAHPFLNNGSFAAFRLLYQDVQSFEDFISQNGEAEAELIASKMAGRWRDGTPIEVSTQTPENLHLLGKTLSSEYQLNNFDYMTPSAHQEPNPLLNGQPDFGQGCPYAAHVRRANPRDDASVKGNKNFQTGAALMAVPNRVLRRARPYGPLYHPDDELSANQQRGLIGFFIGADIGRQFEFLMSQWITGNTFASNDRSQNGGGYDPLFGSPAGVTNFEYCVPGNRP